MCKHHQLLAQCQINDAKTIKEGMKGHGPILTKHEISYLS
jgi:hypothetical protein